MRAGISKAPAAPFDAAGVHACSGFAAGQLRLEDQIATGDGVAVIAPGDFFRHAFEVAGIDRLKASPEFKTGRRKAIEKTFRWLESLAESYSDA